MNFKKFDTIIKSALEEDLGNMGDVTSEAIFTHEQGTAALVCKDTGILAGIPLFFEVFLIIDETIQCINFFKDGDKLKPGDCVARVSGNVKNLLKAERTALNFLSYLSGIATEADRLMTAARETGKSVILDTRKTMPGYRELAKYAVKTGGAQNHRMGLFDMILIKDNHVDAAGGIRKSIEKVRQRWGGQFKVEVECRNLEEVEEALAVGVDIIMLDNMSCDMMKHAVKMCSGKTLLEASGNMDLNKIREVSAIGVDYISVGAITKSVKAFDFSLDMETKA
ncbi:MAG: carboxylating nicotinate-nucleotide diphosphorylase [Spirochaetales bacterium]|nr:carboxylating nicotinate-nucleotide diphosphorylase [Spirochaetales bacterium]